MTCGGEGSPLGVALGAGVLCDLLVGDNGHLWLLRGIDVVMLGWYHNVHLRVWYGLALLCPADFMFLFVFVHALIGHTQERTCV